MDSLFIPITGNTIITVYPKDIHNKLNDKLLSNLKNELEGKCVKEGFVREKSVKIINRSLGQGQSSTFDGSMIFNIEYSMEICNPLEGAIIEVQVLNVNKMGVLAGIPYQADSPLNIMLAKQHHVDNEEFESLNVDYIIKVRVVGKRFEYGDTQISIIAVLDSIYNQFVGK